MVSKIYELYDIRKVSLESILAKLQSKVLHIWFECNLKKLAATSSCVFVKLSVFKLLHLLKSSQDMMKLGEGLPSPNARALSEISSPVFRPRAGSFSCFCVFELGPPIHERSLV